MCKILLHEWTILKPDLVLEGQKSDGCVSPGGCILDGLSSRIRKGETSIHQYEVSVASTWHTVIEQRSSLHNSNEDFCKSAEILHRYTLFSEAGNGSEMAGGGQLIEKQCENFNQWDGPGGCG